MKSDGTKYDWAVRWRWLGHVKKKGAYIPEINVVTVAGVRNMSVEELLLEYYREGFLTGSALEDAKFLETKDETVHKQS